MRLLFGHHRDAFLNEVLVVVVVLVVASTRPVGAFLSTEAAHPPQFSTSRSFPTSQPASGEQQHHSIQDSRTTTCEATAADDDSNIANDDDLPKESGNKEQQQSLLLDSDSTSAVLTARNLEAYNLLWSPGAWKKLALGVSSLALGHIIWSSTPAAGWLLPASWWQKSYGISSCLQSNPLVSSFLSNLMLPLAASACCLLQLGINLLAGGCAGFNTVLGPTRPYFLSLLLYLSITTRSPFQTLAWRWVVALLPEALDVWNRYYLERPKNNVMMTMSTMSGSSSSFETKDGSSSSSSSPLPIQATVSLSIPTMGCVACINTIDSALRQTSVNDHDNDAPPNVLQAASSLNPLGAKGGQARVQVQAANQPELERLVEALVESVQEAGFDSCQVESVRTTSTLS